jgi:putative ABC transport system permease protein
MTFRQLALKNVKGHWHQYSAFFLSCTFSVMIFSMFASFIFNSDVVHGHIQGASYVRNGLNACEYIIIIFSFLFVLYSESAFIKSRKKEFGLLSLFGMTGHQIRKLVFFENMFIASLSILSGLILGTLFSKLFLMVISHFLNASNPIQFQLVPKAILITVVGFLLLFGIVTSLQLFSVGKSEIIDLLKASRKPKSVPVFSRWLVALTVVTLLLAYGMAYFTSMGTLIVFMFPVLGLILIGTYFLFTQGSVASFKWLQKKVGVYYKGTHLITLSQMTFKMKDNARVLFMVAILSAVVLTASGTLFIFSKGMLLNVTQAYPQSFSFVVNGSVAGQSTVSDQVERVLKNDGVNLQDKLKISGVPVNLEIASLWKTPINTLLISNSDYNNASRIAGTKPIKLQKGQAMFVYAGPNMARTYKNGETGEIDLNGTQYKFTLTGHGYHGIINLGSEAFGTFVVSNQDYARLISTVSDSQKRVAYGYDLKNWQKAGPTVQKIKHLMPKNDQMGFRSRVENYNVAKQIASLTMFIGIFVSLLFFIAAGSLIYFKLFTELQEDHAQFQALQRIGMTDREIKKIVTRQIAFIFFVPFVIGAIHALFAFKMLQNMQLFGDIWGYGGIVIGIFFLMQLLYFFITRKTYIRQLLS